MLACFAYIRAMFRGEARPNRMTWFMWSLAPMIATAAGLWSGVTWAALPVFMSGFMPFLIFLFSFVTRNAYWKLETFDWTCGIFSLLALILWAVTKQPDVAIIFAILSDGSAAIPTIQKAWSHPKTENWTPFGAGLISALTSYFAIQSWTFAACAFPTYLIVVNLIIVYSLLRRRSFKG